MKSSFIFKFWVIMLAVSAAFSLSWQDEERLVNEHEGIIRFHVIANSDSEDDQNLKLAVRDQVVTRLQEALEEAETINDSRTYIENNMEEINSWARSCIRARGYDYETRICLGVAAIPARQYDDIYFPAGNYEALTITIGEGKGQNWWCVIFPPLCLVDCSGENGSQYLKEEGEGRLVLKSRLLEILRTETEQKAVKKPIPSI